jgi:hypothetical protein
MAAFFAGGECALLRHLVFCIVECMHIGHLSFAKSGSTRTSLCFLLVLRMARPRFCQDFENRVLAMVLRIQIGFVGFISFHDALVSLIRGQLVGTNLHYRREQPLR